MWVETHLDLRELNKFVCCLKFRMATLSSIIPSVGHGGWFRALDLKSAYFPIVIHLVHREILRFVATQQRYQWLVLPFGVAVALRVFANMLSVLETHFY